MTSSIERPRRCFALCSPIDQRMASTMFDLPHPFGPTMPMISCSKFTTVRSTKDLNPHSSRRLIFNCSSARNRTPDVTRELTSCHLIRCGEAVPAPVPPRLERDHHVNVVSLHVRSLFSGYA